MTDGLAAIAQNGVVALRRGDARSARAAFDHVVAAGYATQQLRLLQAQACAMLGDRAAAHHALDALLAVDPANLYALILRGDLHIAAGDQRAAVSWYQAALSQAPRAGVLPADLLASLRRAQTAVAGAGQAFQDHLDRHLAEAGVVSGSAGARFDEALRILAGDAPVQLQQPTNFYYPGLAPRPFFDRADFEWVAALEAAAPIIREELNAALADPNALKPYVAAEADRPAKRHALLDDADWSAFHLFRNGRAVPENAERCPQTMAALAALPIPYIAGRSPMALFSVLRGGTHIPAHCGMLNTRLICHLPLIVPENCRLRVGNVTRIVEQDRAMIFDDSIEHEAWNDSSTTRVVLLFEIWRPDLTAAEQMSLTALYEAISVYTGPIEDQAGA